MKKIINIILITIFLTGLSMVVYAKYTEFTQLQKIEKKSIEADAIIPILENKLKDSTTENVIPSETLQTPAVIVEQKIKTLEELTEEGSITGMISIPKFSKRSAILQGVDLTTLSYGIGHYNQTGWPGSQKQIFLAGHNNREFNILQYLAPGDLIKIKMPYGEYEYYVSGNKYVDKSDIDVVKSENLGKEELVLMTCFPFDSWGDAPKRFLVYAYPK
jgi:LPXTG-site transpeptidase (sortase) family protein